MKILLLIIISLSSQIKSETVKILTAADRDEFFQTKIQSEYFTCLFFNSSESAITENHHFVYSDLQTRISNEDFTVNHLIFDYKESEEIKRIYGLTGNPPFQLYFYIFNQRQKYPYNFPESSRNLFYFILNLKNSVFRKLPSIDYLRHPNHETAVGLFLGNKNPNFEETHKFALQNINFEIFYSLESSIRDDMARIFKIALSPKKDYFLIIRNILNCTEIDREVSVYSPVNFWVLGLQHFFDYHKTAKIKEGKDLNEIVKSLYHKSQPILLLYLSQNSTHQKELYSIYFNAVKMLPNKMHFAVANQNEPESSSVTHLFMGLGYFPEANCVYQLYLKGGAVQAKMLQNWNGQGKTSEYNFENLVISVQKFYDGNKDIFIQNQDPRISGQIKSENAKNIDKALADL